MAGLFARSIVIIDSNGVVKYTQLVDEITTDPDFESALQALN